MSTLIAFADRAGHVIWSLSWQLAVLVFLVWLVSLFCKNQSPGFRYLLWCVVLVRLCFPVDLSLPIPIAVGGHVEKAAEVSIAAVFIEPQHSRLPAFPRMNEPQFEPSFAPQATAMDFSQPAPVAEPEPIALSVKLVAAWAIIAIALAGLVMFRLIQANLFLRRCPPITDPDFLQHLETLRQSVGVRQKISVATVDPVKGNGGPFVFGTLRPCLLIPQYMLTEWSRKELEPVLLHELAHIKRKDLLVNFLQIMSQIVFFFHPLVWFANHRIRHERELACDDLAIAHCGSGCKRYSQSILRVIEERQNGQWIFSAATIGIAEQQNSLGKRIVRIMNKNYRFHQRMGVLSIAAVVALSALCVAFASGRKPDAPASKDPVIESVASTVETNTVTTVDPLLEEIKADWWYMKYVIWKYRMTHADQSPEKWNIMENKEITRDRYSPTGAGYNYEPKRRGYLFSTCGKDGVHGTDDDYIAISWRGHLNWDNEDYMGYRKDIPAVLKALDATDQVEHPTEHRPVGTLSISGRVVDAETKSPVGNATVILFHMDTHRDIQIDVAADGTFHFKDLPAGQYSLESFCVAGYQDYRYNPGETGLPYESFMLGPEAPLNDLRFELKRAYVITGKIHNEDGTPLKIDDDSYIRAWGKATNEWFNGYRIVSSASVGCDVGDYFLTDLDGSPVYVMAGDPCNHLKDKPYQPTYYPGTFSRDEATQITFAEGEYVKRGINITLKKAGGRVVEGRITDQETGRPVSNALVVVHHKDMFFDRSSAYTDEEGQYRFECLGAGDLMIHVDATPFGYVRQRDELLLGGDPKPVQRDFALETGATLRGQVVNEQGEPQEIAKGYGSAQLSGASTNGSGFSGLRHRLYTHQQSRFVSFHLGTGPYEFESFRYLNDTSFEITGMHPGKLKLTFDPKIQGKKVVRILHNGKDILTDGLTVSAGEVVEGVTIVVGSVAE